MSTAHKPSQALMNYVAGFALSILLTISAYVLVVDRLFTGRVVLTVVLLLAVAQLTVQLLFFLHLGEEKKPRLNLMSFLFAAMVVSVVVIGSIWIMWNLDKNMMPGHQQDEYLLEQYDKGGF